MPNILLLAEETHGARLKSDLEYLGHDVQHLPWRDDVGHLLESDSPNTNPVDLIIIDLENPSDSLAQTVERIRQHPQMQTMPLLVAADEPTVLNLNFSLGIDDFVVKPYSIREMEARLRLAFWNNDRPEDEQTIKVEELVINLDRYEVRVKGVVAVLTLKEYELLKHLVTHRGRVFTRSDLLDSIWGYDYYGGMRTVDVHVRRLRSKLGDMGEAIITVRGVGYSFDLP
jgi:two-component system alkaline phosphatase synthesis response regulator PhoP